MTPLKNDRLIKALLRQPVDRTPVWIMRQAGRYLPEFREMRTKAPNFMDFCRQPELACEVTLQPLKRFDLDAAIIFSDILTVIDALDFNLEFIKGVGPVVHNPVTKMSDLDHACVESALEKLQYVFDAVSVTRSALKGQVPLIGFAGSPWTVACYMVAGGNINQFQAIREMQYQNPDVLHRLLEILTQVTIRYINRQIEAGAQAIMLFDSWGGLLPAHHYSAFSLSYMQRIGAGMIRNHNGEKIPLTFFTKNGGLWLEQTAQAGCDAVGLDWTIDIAAARARVGDQVALQGNLDPMALFGSKAQVRSEVKRIIEAFGQHPGHVFNLGHGIDKNTPIESVETVVKAVHEYSAQGVIVK